MQLTNIVWHCFYLTIVIVVAVPFAVEERSGTITVVDEMNHYDRLLYDFEAVVTDDSDITLITNVTIHVVHSDSAFSAK